ncbi:MAG: sigma-70 family RNA polymerase sigma factor [Paludibacteraceae bacterium]|nr:sigma-70 family RNA polymerase sigma factor [Paludibacteraceae bacterium]
MSDRDIVSALLSRNRYVTEAYFYRKCYPLFKACFDKYYTDCENCIEFINEIYLYLMLPNPESHESYMQRFSFRCSLTGWLKIVAETYCHQLFRKKGEIIQESLDDTDRFTELADSIPIEHSSFANEDLKHVLAMMPNMRYRELIRLRYVESYSNEETAEKLGMSMNNYYNKHLLAKKQFVTALRKEGLL